MQGSKYLVSGFVQHVNGHFIAFVRCGGRWWKCDDSIVTGPADVSTMWPTLIFLEKYRRRSLLAPPALTPYGNIARLRCLPSHLSRAVLEAGRATKSGHDELCRNAGSHRCLEHMGYVGRFALGERLRRQERQRRRKRKLSADCALPDRVAKRRKRDVRKRTGRKQQQQRTGRTQQRTGRTQQRTGRMQQRSGRKDQRLDSRRRQRTAFGSCGAANMDGSRQDPWAEEDHPFNRFKANHGLFRAAVEQLRERPEMAIIMPQQPCLLCEADFGDRSALLQHIDQKHGGLQRYRNAMLVLESLCPHVVVRSEVRQYVRNYATFLREARMDWDGAEDASLRCRLGCCFCARSFWKEELWEVFLAGEQCFMLNPDAVWKFLSVERYKQRWPLIPEAELLASSVSVSDSFGQKVQVLLHKRRVDGDMTCGNSPASVSRLLLCIFPKATQAVQVFAGQRSLARAA